MSEDEAAQAGLKRKALEAFVVGNKDLEWLGALLDQFNIFEAIGVVRQELRHSDFLAFLLDPRENHGLGDLFAKRLLQHVIKDAEHDSLALTSIELELSNLGQMTILREWQHIDILLLDESNRLAIVIENKIGADEHSDQLQRYYQTVCQRYPDYRIVGLYLTPSGEEPSHEAYLPVSCREIYRKHQRALDLIYEHRPDAQAEIKDLLEDLIRSEPRLVRDSGGKKIIRFTVQGWDAPALLTSSGRTRSKRILMFEFWNNPDGLWLVQLIGPGSDETRQKLFEMARSNTEVFDVAPSLTKWTGVFNRRHLEQEMHENSTASQREEEIRRRWAEFLERDLPRIDAVLKEEQWIWDRVDEAKETTR